MQVLIRRKGQRAVCLWLVVIFTFLKIWPPGQGILGNLCLLCGDDLNLRGQTQLALENKNGLHQLVGLSGHKDDCTGLG